MGAPHDHPDRSFEQRGPMFWLPPHGFGNGVPAFAWAELADLTEDEMAEVMFTLAEHGIGGYVAERGSRLRSRLRSAARSVHPPYRLWVDTLQYRRAEDLLMDLLHERRRRGLGDDQQEPGR